MSLEKIIEERGITEILHFTTHLGLTGILHHRELRARSFIKDDESLEFILKLNTTKIFDAPWKGHANLSISRINTALFGYSEYWHPEESWRILAFDPLIMCHEGVHFVTTNNAYSKHLKRGLGEQALNALFADKVQGKYGATIERTKTMPNSWTTDIQAEVLYPRAVSTQHLKTIYVRTEADTDLVVAALAALQHPLVPIKVAEEMFC